MVRHNFGSNKTDTVLATVDGPLLDKDYCGHPFTIFHGRQAVISEIRGNAKRSWGLFRNGQG